MPTREPGMRRVVGERPRTSEPAVGACISWPNSATEAAETTSRGTHARVGEGGYPWDGHICERSRDKRKFPELSVQHCQGEHE